MRRVVEGIDRGQTTLFPECLEDWIHEENPVRLIDAFVEKACLIGTGLSRGGCRGHWPAFVSSIGLLKLCFYGYLNRSIGRNCPKSSVKSSPTEG
jgi:hypothetical protein